MNKWSFGIDNDKLIKLVLEGKKRATTSNYDENELPVIGEQSIIVFDNGKDACIVETQDYKILKFKDIDSSLSDLEGEGDFNSWKENHIKFFKMYDDTFNEDTTVVFETFKLIKDLTKKSMNKKQIIDVINKYKLDKSKFIVISGAALVLLGIKKETQDIDIWCDNDYCDYLLNNYDCNFERINELGKKAYLIDDVINFGISFKPKEVETVEGIQCSSLKDILELKKFLNRDKDKDIISKIEKILKNTNN